ncbi:MAG: hypothetical protein J7L98_07100 [Candidatus Verstraetearchaeota archaeon]|nr:hypothetical protein [Candidatus Verstraetearchaeota archaeon]
MKPLNAFLIFSLAVLTAFLVAPFTAPWLQFIYAYPYWLCLAVLQVIATWLYLRSLEGEER